MSINPKRCKLGTNMYLVVDGRLRVFEFIAFNNDPEYTPLVPSAKPVDTMLVRELGREFRCGAGVYHNWFTTPLAAWRAYHKELCNTIALTRADHARTIDRLQNECVVASSAINVLRQR